MYLRPFQEIIGILKSIDSDESLIKIKFTIDLELDIPKNACPIDQLKKFIGKRIGLINNDGKYLIRELD